jgi:hypothetical protein
MPPAGFQPATPATKRQQTYALDRVATGIGAYLLAVNSKYKYTVGYATTNDATTNECYNEQFLAIKSGCYSERGGP